MYEGKWDNQLSETLFLRGHNGFLYSMNTYGDKKFYSVLLREHLG